MSNKNLVTLHDQTFEMFIKENDISIAVDRIANQINQDFKDDCPIFVSVLNGSFVFASDLLRRIEIKCYITFLKLASYKSETSTGEVKQLIGLNENLTEKRVIVLEDIVDSGLTLNATLNSIREFNPLDISTAVLLYKPSSVKMDVKIDYLGFEVPNDFVVGYGLDYNGLGRNLNGIYKKIDA